MKADVVTRSESSCGAMLETVVRDGSGRALFSLPGSALIDVHGVVHSAGRTVILPGRLPLSAATAMVGLPAYKAIGHSIVWPGTTAGNARVSATSIVGDALFIEFDRDVTPAADQIVVLPEGRLCVLYESAVEVDLSVAPSSGSDEVVTTI